MRFVTRPCCVHSALFFFGLYEAGTLMENPVKAVSVLVPLDDLKYTLSEDLVRAYPLSLPFHLFLFSFELGDSFHSFARCHSTPF